MPTTKLNLRDKAGRVDYIGIFNPYRIQMLDEWNPLKAKVDQLVDITNALETADTSINGVRGNATFNGDGAALAFTINHTLGSVPTSYNVQPTAAGSAGAHFVSSVTATTIVVTFAAAPAIGTGNVAFNWFAK